MAADTGIVPQSHWHTCNRLINHAIIGRMGYGTKPRAAFCISRLLSSRFTLVRSADQGFEVAGRGDSSWALWLEAGADSS